jgi:hypothetical protein
VEESNFMRVAKVGFCIMVGAVVFAAGCHSKVVDREEFRMALNNYLAGQQKCLWPAPVKFPAQADTNNENQTQGFDALTDAGLLTRMPAEKKRFLIGSKQVNDYDLSDQGRSHWTADPGEPGYGNFCFGHPSVISIDGFVPDTGGASQYSVSYHFGVSLPDWANTAEIKTAFPSAAVLSSGQAATATLTGADNSWQVQNVASATGVPRPQ